jgi:hypothetical protein
MILPAQTVQPASLDAETHFRADMEAIRQAASSFTSSHDLGEILDFILSVTASLIPADEMHIFLYSDGALTLEKTGGKGSIHGLYKTTNHQNRLS